VKAGAITSRDNPLLTRLRKLARDPGGYRKSAVVLLEGEHLCTAYAAHGGRPSHALVVDPGWQAGPLRQLAGCADTTLVVAPALMEGIGTLATPAPIAFVVAWPGRTAVRPGAASLVLDRVQDAGNVGSMLRSAAAFGFSQVIALAGTAALWSPKVLRAAMGAHFALHLVEADVSDGDGVLDALQVPLIATSSHARDPIHEAALGWPCAWIVGNEGQGVAAKLLQRAAVVRIAQPGGQESLNVAVAAALCMYESTRGRRPAAP
jgi:TrmH family RNA methyltransferase